MLLGFLASLTVLWLEVQQQEQGDSGVSGPSAVALFVLLGTPWWPGNCLFVDFVCSCEEGEPRQGYQAAQHLQGR